MKSAKKRKIKTKRVTFVLSEQDYSALDAYAASIGCTRAIAARKAVRDKLLTFKKNSGSDVGENQLNIFDSIQIDIFNNESRTILPTT